MTTVVTLLVLMFLLSLGLGITLYYLAQQLKVEEGKRELTLVRISKVLVENETIKTSLENESYMYNLSRTTIEELNEEIHLLKVENRDLKKDLYIQKQAAIKLANDYGRVSEELKSLQPVRIGPQSLIDEITSYPYTNYTGFKRRLTD